MLCSTCNENNPDDAAFCGGCGADLSAAAACQDCGRTHVPGMRFCRGCGASLTTTASPPPKLDAVEQRLATLETDLADMALEVASLIALKEQLQEALDGMRKRAPTAAAVKSVAPNVPPRAATTPPVTHEPVAALATVRAQPANANGERVTILHLDDQSPYQDALRNLIEKFGYARYCSANEPPDGGAAGRRLLAVNLLVESREPLIAVAETASWGVESPCAFTYCGDGTRGFSLGLTEFFPPPFEPNLCVTRLLERPSPAQKLLVVSDALDATSELRSILTRLGCATSVAFDGKQALNLLPMVRPDTILVDLNLPKGDALRVISKVRADPAYGTVTFALMWQTAIAAADFRQQVARVAKELPFSADDLRRAMGRELGPGGAAYVNTASKAA